MIRTETPGGLRQSGLAGGAGSTEERVLDLSSIVLYIVSVASGPDLPELPTEKGP